MVYVVGLLTEFTLLIMVEFVVVAATEFASDLAVWVDLVSKLPAPGTLDEVYLLGPLEHVAGGMEDNEGV